MRIFRSHCVRLFAFIVCLIPTAALLAQTVSPASMGDLKWRMIGPFRGGRVVAVAGIAGDAAIFYFGSVNGGIWKTTDAGAVWTPIFDGQPVGSIGALAIAPSDPKIIYAGTGETDIRSDLSSGIGMYRSGDGGTTWKHIGLEGTRQISRIVVDPQNASVVYVGALGHAYGPNPERGVYKSTDGGEHWTLALNLGPEIGISDLAMASSVPSLFFAGAWHSHRPPWSTYAPIDGPGGGLYRSQDAGKSWSRLQGNGLPDGDWGRVGVDVAPDGRRTYALISVKAQPEKSGLYRSDDGGDHWTLANADPRLTSRAWYFNRVTVDPENADVLYMPNVALYRSEDGGKTISVLRGAPGGDDYHQLWIDPKNSSRMVLGTDQGTTVSLNRGETWSTWYNQPTAQFYHVTTDNQFPYTVYGAQQDSGSAAVVSRTDHARITPRDWITAGESESGYLVVDAANPNIIYLSGTFGPIARFNKKTGLSQDITPWPAMSFGTEINKRKYRAPWTPVLAASAADPKALYLGTQYVMKTMDGGLNWETISPDLTGSEQTYDDRESSAQKQVSKDETSKTQKEQAAPSQGSSAPEPTVENAKATGFGVVYAIAASPIRREVIWAGSDSGLIHVTRDDGKTWKNVTPPGLSDWSKISMIEASHFDPAVAYAAVDRSRLDDQAPYLYRTRDYGATWQRINEGMTAPAFMRAVREDPKRRGLLFAGTELGVYVSFDDGDRWQSIQMNLPATSVRDLNVHGDDLVIATHGRSFWVLDDISPLREMNEALKKNAPFLFRPAEAVRIDNDSFPGTPLPPEEPTADNPPSGAIIDYVLSGDAKSVQLEIIDAQKKLVRQFSSENHSAAKAAEKRGPVPIAERWLTLPQDPATSAGMHRFVWDLRWAGLIQEQAQDEDGPPLAPKAVPGTYRVRLTVDGKVQEQPLHLTMDPRSPTKPEDLAQQLQLGLQIFGETDSARRVIEQIGSMQKQLASDETKANASGQTDDIHTPGPNQPSDGAGNLASSLRDSQVSMTAIVSGDGRNRGAKGLQEAADALASVLRVVEGGDRAVPSQALAVYKEASEQAKKRVAEWEKFKQTTLRQLNEKLQQAAFEPIKVPNEQ